MKAHFILNSTNDVEVIKSEEFSSKVSTKAYLEACVHATDQTDFFARHGLNEKTIKKFRLGFDPKRQAVVFPFSSELECYQTYSLVDKTFSAPHADNTALPIFNPKGLWVSKKKPVFVVMTPINAISILQCGGNAIALCGVDINQFIETIKVKNPMSPLILALNHNPTVRTISEILAAELTNAGINHIVYHVSEEKEDPNELLVADEKRLIRSILKAEDVVRQKYPRGFGSISARDLHALKPTSPAFLVEDILPCGLAVLCAESKVGKSWMAIDLCISLAQGKPFLKYASKKVGCLYLALEDSRSRLDSRMLKILDGNPIPEGIHFSTRASTLDDGLIQQLNDELEDNPNIKLIIIDRH